MTEKPEFNEGWGPALEGKEWEAYKKKQLEYLTYRQDFMNAYSSLRDSEISPELNRLINAAFGAIDTSKELLSHMSYVRVERENEKRKSTSGLRNGGRFSPWKAHESIILDVISELISPENFLKSRSEKLTQEKAMRRIEQRIPNKLNVPRSTFSSWVKYYKSNNGKFIYSKED